MKKLMTFTAALLLTALLSAVAQAAGTLIYAAQADAVGLSPILTNDSVSSVAKRHIYENLIRRNPETLELEPWLATAWETPDDTTWVFHLREGVTFQDGTPFNAEAVKFTFDRIKDPEVAAPRASLLEPVSNIEVVDEYTVRITTDPPYGAFLAALAHTNAAIVSPTAVEKNGDLMRNPVGTGSFRLEEWRSGDRIIMTRNPDYWGEAPSLDGFEIRVVPDANTQVALLQRGDIDLVDSLPPELIGQLQSTAGVEVDIQPGTPVFYLGFNYQNPTWQTPATRQAIASAINTDVIVQLLNPVAQGSCSIIRPLAKVAHQLQSRFMKYNEIKGLKPEAFKRLTGVKPEVFGQMLSVLCETERAKKKAGRSSKLGLEDQLLLTLSYWREYRTQFHIAASYSVHESTANRIITKVEDRLIISGKFSLPKRREVAETEWTVVLVDVTETPIERPKKSSITTVGRKDVIR